jgi:hypothetical protein
VGAPSGSVHFQRHWPHTGLAAAPAPRYIHPQNRETAMAKGLCRDGAGWVQVGYDRGFEMPMKKSEYEDHDYKPRYDTLPVRHPFATKKSETRSSTKG